MANFKGMGCVKIESSVRDEAALQRERNQSSSVALQLALAG
jgi:hypothetical protein